MLIAVEAHSEKRWVKKKHSAAHSSLDLIAA